MLGERLVKIGAKVTPRILSIIFQIADVAVPRQLLDRSCRSCPPAVLHAPALQRRVGTRRERRETCVLMAVRQAAAAPARVGRDFHC
jgi:hypothetical protein